MQNNSAVRFSSSQIEILKLAAIAFMFLDHLNKIFFEFDYLWMFFVGRMAFPLFCLIAAYHYEFHTRDKQRYMLRLLAFGAVSQIFYVYATQRYDMLNIFFTLGFGVGLLILLDRIEAMQRQNPKNKCVAEIAAFLLLIGVASHTEYYQAGMALIPALALYIRKQNSWTLFLAMVLTLACNLFSYFALFGLAAYALAYAVGMMQIPQFRLPRYVYYAFYPLHLAVLRFLA